MRKLLWLVAACAFMAGCSCTSACRVQKDDTTVGKVIEAPAPVPTPAPVNLK